MQYTRNMTMTKTDRDTLRSLQDVYKRQGLDGGPVDVHIGLLFQTLEDGAVVRLGFAAHREAGHTGKGDLFGQRKCNGTGRVHSCSSSITAAGGFAAATGLSLIHI